MSSRGPLLVAIVLLLLPVLYVGSYLALLQRKRLADPYYIQYRWGGKTAKGLYWPLEQIDRRLRPGHWSEDGLRPYFDG